MIQKSLVEREMRGGKGYCITRKIAGRLVLVRFDHVARVIVNASCLSLLKTATQS
jgi:hypothetical protein